ncbi:hypothetical protein RCCWILLIS_58 [Rhodobacter phage RcCWillis]|nr:hypothetical protein RCCWILLIS_58 [Rhodobacter phage RcCWillis]
MIEPNEYRLICIKRGNSWQVEMRAGAWWSVGWFDPDLDKAIQNAREKFAEDHPMLGKKPAPAQVAPPPPTSSTDLSDLFI